MTQPSILVPARLEYTPHQSAYRLVLILDTTRYTFYVPRKLAVNMAKVLPVSIKFG